MIEVMVIIAIIGVLAAIAIPSYRIQMLKVKNQEAVRILMALWEAEMDYYRENGAYTSNLADLPVDIPTPKNFQMPVVGGPFCGMGGPPPYIAAIQYQTGQYSRNVYLLKSTALCAPSEISRDLPDSSKSVI